jgi:hypothetical protein
MFGKGDCVVGNLCWIPDPTGSGILRRPIFGNKLTFSITANGTLFSDEMSMMCRKPNMLFYWGTRG